MASISSSASRAVRARSTTGPVDCALTGSALLTNPYFNRGTGFTAEERVAFGLSGLLPSRVNSLTSQAGRAYEQYLSRPSALNRNTFMTSLKDQNEVLFYRVVGDHIKEMFPIIYTPTEGDAIANYSRLFRRPEGCFLNIEEQDDIEEALDKWGDPEDVDIICCSDGEQILGIGDQGVGAILISIAKLVIYTLCAGIHPNRTLPVVLDAGTNNQALHVDPLYLGLTRPRARGPEYDAFIDRFVRACRARYPRALIHFEDFGLSNARRILDRYAGQLACFNDDVQGTGCVTLAALYTACRVAGYSFADVRVVMFGAGTAGTGIADQIRGAIALECGISVEQAARQIWCVDKHGLLLQSDGEDLTTAQRHYARPDAEWPQRHARGLAAVIDAVRPHILIGTSTHAGAFTESIVRAMATHVKRPIILPLSNPTRLHEAVPSDLLEWTRGAALVATGSPFDPVSVNVVDKDGRSRKETREIAECNNSTIFPGIGLGTVLVHARLLSPAMLVAATKALAACAPALKGVGKGGSINDGAPLLPDVTEVREISVRIAVAVIRQAVAEGLAQEPDIPDIHNDERLEGWIRAQMWQAEYRPLRQVDAREATAAARGELGSRGRSGTVGSVV